MAILRTDSEEVQFTLEPYCVAESGEPAFVGVLLQLRRGSHSRLGPVQVIMLVRGIRRIARRLRDVSTEHMEATQVATLDSDFILDVRSTESLENHRVVAMWQADEEVEERTIAIGFWASDRDELMRGYRFVAAAERVGAFAGALESELAAVLAAGSPNRFP